MEKARPETDTPVFLIAESHRLPIIPAIARYGQEFAIVQTFRRQGWFSVPPPIRLPNHFIWNLRALDYVLQLLENDAKALDRYGQVLDRYAVKREMPTKDNWDDRRRKIVHTIAESVAKTPLAGPEVESFLEWPDEPDAPALAARRVQDNIYGFRKNGRGVVIQVGSIHSVKGKNNTSTLVLETYWYDHNLDSIKNWLCKGLRGGESQSDRIQTRLKLQYVAMTRPTHLLCLAMKRKTFLKDEGCLDQEVVQELESRGWHVRDV